MDPTAGIAWEAPDRPFFDRLWSTVRDATIDPVATFKATGIPGSGGAAVRFTLITSAVGYFPMLLCVPCIGVVLVSMASAILSSPHLPAAVRGLGAGALCGMVAAIPVFVVIFSLFVEVTYGVVFHAVSVLAGGKGSFGASMRAMMYTGAIRFWLFVPLVLQMIPFVGFVFHWGARFLMLVWSGFAAYGAALGVHQLPEDRAVLVGVVTPFATFVITMAGFVGSIALFVTLVFGSLGAIGNFLPH